VVLPACSSFEKDGTFMNAERRVQRVRRVIEPVGDSRPDWRIVCDVAREMGHAERFAYESAEAIWDEIRTVWAGARGMSYGRLEHRGLQWPCPSENHPGTDILHRDGFGAGARARLRPIEFVPSGQAVSPEFPFLLNTGRTLYQFNAATMTGRTPNSLLRSTDLLEISPDDAARLGLEDGQRARVISRDGEAVLPVRITPRVRVGELFATFHAADVMLNRVTGVGRDRVTGTPEYKVTAVRVESL
jgi:formate dehydrogenase major subunit